MTNPTLSCRTVERHPLEVGRSARFVPDIDVWRVAVHEAGHAAIANALGLEVIEVTLGAEIPPLCAENIFAHAGSFGRCRVVNPFSGRPDRDGFHWLRRVCTMRAAGIEAERLYFRGTAVHGRFDAESIQKTLRGVLALVGRDDNASFEALKSETHRKARRMAQRHQAAIERVAAKLLTRKRLTGAEVIQAVRGNHPDPAQRRMLSHERFGAHRDDFAFTAAGVKSALTHVIETGPDPLRITVNSAGGVPSEALANLRRAGQTLSAPLRP